MVGFTVGRLKQVYSRRGTERNIGASFGEWQSPSMAEQPSANVDLAAFGERCCSSRATTRRDELMSSHVQHRPPPVAGALDTLTMSAGVPLPPPKSIRSAMVRGGQTGERRLRSASLVGFRAEEGRPVKHDNPQSRQDRERQDGHHDAVDHHLAPPLSALFLIAVERYSSILACFQTGWVEASTAQEVA